jgi:dTDP-3-amino-3,4,6-trideoxy-alpha-D-glucose transaminase
MLPHLDSWCDGRRAGAAAYAAAGVADHVGVCAVPSGVDPAWHLFVVTHPQADEVLGALNRAGIQARGYYRRPLHRQPAMAPYLEGLVPVPVAEEIGATNIALPISPVFTEAQAAEVVAALASAV